MWTGGEKGFANKLSTVFGVSADKVHTSAHLIKNDPSTVKYLSTSPTSAQIVNAIICIADLFGLTTKLLTP